MPLTGLGTGVFPGPGSLRDLLFAIFKKNT